MSVLLWIPAGISWFWSWLWIRKAPRRLLDIPNRRSLHVRPVPRGGGVGVVLGVWAACWAWRVHRSQPWPTTLCTLLLAASLLALFSFLDDIRSLSPLLRLGIQAALSLGWLLGGDWLVHLQLPGWSWSWPPALGWTVSLLGMVWMTNLYNFMDGMDGFAAGMSVVGFATLAWLGYQRGALEYAFLSASLAAASLGFLYFNFPPARLFMGDVGSTFLGFMAAGLILYADYIGLFPAWLGSMAFLPFVADATVTLVKRLARGEKIWRPHKSHYYQRLVQKGWGHRRTLFAEYVLMGFSALMAILLAKLEPAPQRWGLFGVVLVYLVLGWYVERYLRAARS